MKQRTALARLPDTASLSAKAVNSEARLSMDISMAATNDSLGLQQRAATIGNYLGNIGG